MDAFVYKNGNLFCEGICVADLVRKHQTPLYIYSATALTESYDQFSQAYKDQRHLICFSVKANSNIHILRLLVERGSGLDVVSGGELERALRAGCSPQKIVFAGVGKRRNEIERAISLGIKMLNVESVPELLRIKSVAADLNKTVSVSLRVNPDVDPKTHRHITTGKKENKFGLSFEDIRQILTMASGWKNVLIKGLHCHVGSQILTKKPFLQAIKNILCFLEEVDRSVYPLDTLNFGGGVGICYDTETPQNIGDLAKELIPYFRKGLFSEVLFEPGRFIAGSSGILVTEVQYVKKNSEKNFVIVDAAMNDLMRPMLYDSYHEIRPLKHSDTSMTADVVGPICESGDFFAKNRVLAKVDQGDHLAIMNAGAYAFTMSSQYNTRPRCAEILVQGDRSRLIRKRETVEDLLSHETNLLEEKERAL